MPTSFDILADEYYDASMHPTCKNFRDASYELVALTAPGLHSAGCSMADLGAGKSVLGELAVKLGWHLSDAFLIDDSRGMLQHSSQFADLGVRALLANARELPVPGESLDLIVSSLGDPYNDVRFWKEIRRVLSPTGCTIFTTPSWEWCVRYRTETEQGRQGFAKFLLRDGSQIDVPSSILPPIDQEALFEAADLRIKAYVEIPSYSLKGPISTKLYDPRGNLISPVVVGYVVVKR